MTLANTPRLNTESPALRRYGTLQRSAADEAREAAARQRTEAIDLALTFGMIGTEFLSAVVHLMEVLAKNLESVESWHRAIGSGTDRGDDRYTDTDRDGARGIGHQSENRDRRRHIRDARDDRGRPRDNTDHDDSDRDARDRNSGDRNSGDRNSGDRNSGDRNSGDRTGTDGDGTDHVRKDHHHCGCDRECECADRGQQNSDPNEPRRQEGAA